MDKDQKIAELNRIATEALKAADSAIAMVNNRDEQIESYKMIIKLHEQRYDVLLKAYYILTDHAALPVRKVFGL